MKYQFTPAKVMLLWAFVTIVFMLMGAIKGCAQKSWVVMPTAEINVNATSQLRAGAIGGIVFDSTIFVGAYGYYAYEVFHKQYYDCYCNPITQPFRGLGVDIYTQFGHRIGRREFFFIRSGYNRKPYFSFGLQSRFIIGRFIFNGRPGFAISLHFNNRI